MPGTFHLRPLGAYSLARSAAGAGCPTRRWAGGVLDMALDTSAGPARAALRQRADATVEAWIDAPDPALACERLRGLLLLDLDTGPFEQMAERDPLLSPLLPRLRGMRPLSTGSVAHGLLRGVCGQLIRAHDARRIEWAVVAGVARPHGRLHLPITTAELRTLTPDRLRAVGLAESRARSLMRAAREIDLDGLAALPTEEVVLRLTAVPGIGPWTAGVVCLSGLGRVDCGLSGDLGLMKLLAGDGQVPSTAETARLLERYAPFQGLASAYLLASRGARLPATPREIARARPRMVTR